MPSNIYHPLTSLENAFLRSSFPEFRTVMECFDTCDGWSRGNDFESDKSGKKSDFGGERRIERVGSLVEEVRLDISIFFLPPNDIEENGFFTEMLFVVIFLAGLCLLCWGGGIMQDKFRRLVLKVVAVWSWFIFNILNLG